MRKRTREIDAESLAALRAKTRRGAANQEAFGARVVLAFLEGSTYAGIRERFGWAFHTTAK